MNGSLVPLLQGAERSQIFLAILVQAPSLSTWCMRTLKLPSGDKLNFYGIFAM